MTAICYRFGDFELDLPGRQLRCGEEIVPMPVRVLKCLAYLIAHRDRAVARDELGQAIFGRAHVSTNHLGQIVVRARRCLKDDGQSQKFIRTIPRYGFRWVAPVLECSSEDRPVTLVRVASASLDDGMAPIEPGPSLSAAARNFPRRIRSITVAAAAVLSVGIALWWLQGQGGPFGPRPMTAQRATLVMPTTVFASRDDGWVRLGIMDLIAERLRVAGEVVPPSETTLLLSNAGSRDALRTAADADHIVTSHARKTANRWYVELHAESARGDRYLGSATALSPVEAARLASDRLVKAMGHEIDASTRPASNHEELLQRVRSAVLTNQPERARAILMAAPRALLVQSDLQYQLALIDHRVGRFAAAFATLERLLADPRNHTDSLFRARLLVARGRVHFRRNALAAARHDFDEALAMLPERSAHLERGQALNGRAITQAAQGRYDEAIKDLGAARSHLTLAGDKIAVARVDSNLGALEMDRGHPAQARVHLNTALAVFETFNAANEQQVTRSALVAAYLQDLQPRAAQLVSIAALKSARHMPDPTLKLAAHLDHANALIALGRFSEAARVLNDPDVAQPTTPPYEQRRIETLVELAWRKGDALAVVQLADAALPTWPLTAGDDIRDFVRLRREQAAQSANLAPLPDAKNFVASDQRAVAAPLARALVSTMPKKQALFRRALALAEQRGAPIDIVEVVSEYASWLLVTGQTEQAAVLAERVAPWAAGSYDSAKLQLKMAQALASPVLTQQARRDVLALRGEWTSACYRVPKVVTTARKQATC